MIGDTIKRLTGEQLVFGWAPHTMERHGTGNGVLGYSPGWALHYPVTAAELGRLVKLWGDRRSEPRLASGADISALEFTYLNRRRVLVRKTPDSQNRAGAVFVHMIVPDDPGFGLRESLLFDTYSLPHNSITAISDTLPSGKMARIDVPIPPARPIDPTLLPIIEELASTLLDSLKEGRFDRKIVVHVEHPEVARLALLGAVELLPRALTHDLTMSTFEFDIGGTSPEISTAITHLSTVSPHVRRVIATVGTDVDRLGSTFASEGSRGLVATIRRLVASGYLLDENISSVRSLTQWVEAAEQATTPIEEMTDQQVESVLSRPQFADKWVGLGTNLFGLIDRALRSTGVLEALAFAYPSFCVDITNHVADSLFTNPDPGLVESHWALASALHLDQQKIRSRVQEHLIGAVRRGAPLSESHFIATLPKSDQDLDPELLNAILATRQGRQLWAAAGGRLASATAMYELLHPGDGFSVLAGLIEQHLALVEEVVLQCTDTHEPDLLVHNLRFILGDETTFHLLLHMWKYSDDGRSGLLMRALVQNTDLTPSVYEDVIVECWPNVLDWIPMAQSWATALRNSVEPRVLHTSFPRADSSPVTRNIGPSSTPPEAQDEPDKHDSALSLATRIREFFGFGSKNSQERTL